MIWRLLASVLAISDTGSIAVTSESSNWPSEQACRQVVQTHYVAPPPQQIEGHRITMRVAASCVPVDFYVNEAVVPLGYPPLGVGPPYGRDGGPPYTR